MPNGSTVPLAYGLLPNKIMDYVLGAVYPERLVLEVIPRYQLLTIFPRHSLQFYNVFCLRSGCGFALIASLTVKHKKSLFQTVAILHRNSVQRTPWPRTSWMTGCSIVGGKSHVNISSFYPHLMFLLCIYRAVDPDPHGSGFRRVNLSTKNRQNARKLLITASLLSFYK